MRQRRLSQIDENLISMSFDSMSIRTNQSSYSYDHGFYEPHRESNFDIQNEGNYFIYEIFIPHPPQVNIDLSLPIL